MLVVVEEHSETEEYLIMDLGDQETKILWGFGTSDHGVLTLLKYGFGLGNGEGSGHVQVFGSGCIYGDGYEFEGNGNEKSKD